MGVTDGKEAIDSRLQSDNQRLRRQHFLDEVHAVYADEDEITLDGHGRLCTAGDECEGLTRHDPDSPAPPEKAAACIAAFVKSNRTLEAKAF